MNTNMDYLKSVYTRTLRQARDEMGTGCYNDQWQWDQGVMMQGLVKAFERTGDRDIYDFIKYWVDYHLDRMDFGYSINTTAPLLGVMKLLEFEPDNERYQKICKSFADWCLAEEPRADLGAFEHSCTANKYPNQVWADTLFMGCLFLVKWGLFTNEEVYIKEALRQFTLHDHFLRDRSTGLIVHGYDCNTREQKGVAWGRGNCWLAVAGAEVLSLLDKSVDGYDRLLQIYTAHIKSVMKYQEKEGWHTVIDHADTYIEMSATAAFAYSLKKAVNEGILDEDCTAAAEAAAAAVRADIDADGAVQHGSMGTCVMEDYRDYNEIEFGYTYFTQGLALMLLSEE